MNKDSIKIKNKKSFTYYLLIAFVVIFVLNMLISIFFAQSQITPVTYDAFLNDLDSGKISMVQVMEDSILYGIEIENIGEEDPQVDLYSTVRMQDFYLVDKLYEAGVEFTESLPKEPSFLMNIISTVIMIAIFAAVWIFIMSKMSKKMGGNSMSFGKSNAKIYAETKTGKSFQDVAGQEEAKEALAEVVDFLNNPKKYADIGANLPKGVLLVGPPGTGKTLLAKAVAGEAKVPFFSISGSEFVEMFVGMGAAKVRDLFKQANEKAPCIIFIDEIDTIGKKRDSGGIGGNDEREQTLNQLLTEMDGFDGQKGVVLLAASNRPEILDKALTRPGRFDRRVPVELPDRTDRAAILQVHGKNVKMAQDVDYEAVARATSGANGAELANIINEAALRAVRDGRSEVVQSDLEESVEVIIAGYQRKNAVVSEQERKIVSYHEVGHALVAALQNDSAPVHKITIIPRTSGALGYTMQVESDERFLMSKEQALNKIATFTGGRAAEELIFKSITTGASNDIEQATKIARAMITRYGMSEQFGMVALETVNNQYLGGDSSMICSPDTAKSVDDEVIDIIHKQYERAMEILKENEQKLHEISAYLLEKETITGEEFMTILKQ